MVRAVDCHAEVLGSNPGGPKRFYPWNDFNGIGLDMIYFESASYKQYNISSDELLNRLFNNKCIKSTKIKLKDIRLSH